MEQQYKLAKCNSTVEFLSQPANFREYLSRFTNAKAIVWYENRIVFYSIKESKWNKSLGKEKEIVALRLFDKENELHLWRSNCVLKGRLRIDTEDTEEGDSEYITAKPLMNGTVFSSHEDRIHIIAREDKGTDFQLPYYEELNSLIGKKIRLTLVTRNYIDYSPIGQAGYFDCRFVNFESYK